MSEAYTGHLHGPYPPEHLQHQRVFDEGTLLGERIWRCRCGRSDSASYLHRAELCGIAVMEALGAAGRAPAAEPPLTEERLLALLSDPDAQDDTLALSPAGGVVHVPARPDIEATVFGTRLPTRVADDPQVLAGYLAAEALAEDASEESSCSFCAGKGTPKRGNEGRLVREGGQARYVCIPCNGAGKVRRVRTAQITIHYRHAVHLTVTEPVADTYQRLCAAAEATTDDDALDAASRNLDTFVRAVAGPHLPADAEIETHAPTTDETATPTDAGEPSARSLGTARALVHTLTAPGQGGIVALSDTALIRPLAYALDRARHRAGPADTLAAAREAVMRDRWTARGVTCPACDGYAKVYRRRLNGTMAKGLLWLVRQAGDERAWVYVASVGPRWLMASKQWPTLAHWGLVERKHEDTTQAETGTRTSGTWRPTEQGVAFARGELRVPPYVLLYHNQRLRLEGEPIVIGEALPRGFDYAEIMQAAGSPTP